MSLSTKCTCDAWEPNIQILNGPFILQQIRQPGSVRHCLPFKFCPWCGGRLMQECPNCGALMANDSEVKKHFQIGNCQLPVQAPRPQRVDERNRCRVCGTPTFGLYCAVHSKGGRA